MERSAEIARCSEGGVVPDHGGDGGGEDLLVEGGAGRLDRVQTLEEGLTQGARVVADGEEAEEDGHCRHERPRGEEAWVHLLA